MNTGAASASIAACTSAMTWGHGDDATASLPLAKPAASSPAANPGSIRSNKDGAIAS
jgi:hypothetical protein